MKLTGLRNEPSVRTTSEGRSQRPEHTFSFPGISAYAEKQKEEFLDTDRTNASLVETILHPTQNRHHSSRAGGNRAHSGSTGVGLARRQASVP